MKYKINGVTFYQDELTWGQDKALIELFKGAYSRFQESDELEFRVKEFFQLLLEKDMIHSFFKIILRPRKDLRYWLRRVLTKSVNLKTEDLSNSQMEEIVADFFLLNQSLMTKLKTVGSSLGIIAEILETMNGKLTTSSLTGSGSGELTTK